MYTCTMNVMLRRVETMFWPKNALSSRCAFLIQNFTDFVSVKGDFSKNNPVLVKLQYCNAVQQFNNLNIKPFKDLLTKMSDLKLTCFLCTRTSGGSQHMSSAKQYL